MSDRTFVDTNVLIYAHDVDAESKHEVAKHVLRELWGQRSGALSPQVLQELVDATEAEISNAFRIEDDYRIGFWDALIVASALKSGARRILSEDLNAGQTIAGIRIENPFATTH